MEPLASQLGGSSHSSEGLYDLKNSRLERRMKCDYTTPRVTTIHSGTGKSETVNQLGVGAQTACERQNRVKRGIVSDYPCSPYKISIGASETDSNQALLLKQPVTQIITERSIKGTVVLVPFQETILHSHNKETEGKQQSGVAAQRTSDHR